MADLIAALMARTPAAGPSAWFQTDRKSTRLNSSHSQISYAVFCLKKKSKRLNSSHSQISYAVFCLKKKTLTLMNIGSLHIENGRPEQARPLYDQTLHIPKRVVTTP